MNQFDYKKQYLKLSTSFLSKERILLLRVLAIISSFAVFALLLLSIVMDNYSFSIPLFISVLSIGFTLHKVYFIDPIEKELESVKAELKILKESK